MTIQSAAFVAHQIVQALGNGSIAGIRFGKVIIVGHSLSSLVVWVEAINFGDVDGVMRASRQWMLDHAVKSGAIYFSSHFPGTSAGRITGDKGQYKWHPL